MVGLGEKWIVLPHSRYGGLPVAVVLCLMTLAGTAGSESASYSREDLLYGVRQQHSLVKTLQVTFNELLVSEEKPSKTPESDTLVRKRRVTFALDGSKKFVSYSFHRDLNAEGYIFDRTMAFNGEYGARYDPRESQAEIWHGEPSGLLPELTSYLGVMLMCPPQKGADGLDDSNLQSLLRSSNARVRPALERVGDAMCHVVDLVYDKGTAMTVWIDTARGFMPLKTNFFRPGGQLTGEMELTDVREVASGIWLAFKAVRRVHNRYEYSVQVEDADKESPKVKVNEVIPPEMFVIDFPPRTMVYDHVTGMNYVAGGGIDADDLGKYTKALIGEATRTGFPMHERRARAPSESSLGEANLPTATAEPAIPMGQLQGTLPTPSRPSFRIDVVIWVLALSVSLLATFIMLTRRRAGKHKS